MTKSAVPRTTSSMPRVTRNEGIFSRVTNSPLNSPISAATTRLIKNATPSDATPALNSVHMTTGANPNSDPTDRSNSPAVISSVIASAMSPSSTVKVRVLLILRTDRKSGLIALNTASSITSSTNGPNSGAEMRRRSWDFFKRYHRCSGRRRSSLGAASPSERNVLRCALRMQELPWRRRVAAGEGCADERPSTCPT